MLVVFPEAPQEHREINPLVDLTMPALVARKVPKKEVSMSKSAKKAMDDEFWKLENASWPDKTGKGVWDLKGVRSAREVRKEAIAECTVAHFGRSAEMCFEKGSDLPEGHKDRKMKGRDVFLGDKAKDQNFDYAEFENNGSSPSTLEDNRSLDAYSLMFGIDLTGILPILP